MGESHCELVVVVGVDLVGAGVGEYTGVGGVSLLWVSNRWVAGVGNTFLCFFTVK